MYSVKRETSVSDITRVVEIIWQKILKFTYIANEISVKFSGIR